MGIGAASAPTSHGGPPEEGQVNRVATGTASCREAKAQVEHYRELEQKIQCLHSRQEQSLQELMHKEEELEEASEEFREEICSLKNKVIELHEENGLLREELNEAKRRNALERNKY